MVNRQNGVRTCVMIVEQDVNDGFKFADWLATHGYQTVFVRSVEAVIDVLSEIRPQAVFVGRGLCESGAQTDMSEMLRLIQTVCPRVPMVTIVD